MTTCRSAHRLPRWSAALTVVALLAGLFLAVPTGAQTDGPPPRTGPPADPGVVGVPEVVDPPPGEITRVIVELATPARPAVELSPPEEATQQGAIASAQDSVGALVADTGSEVVATFEHVPGMAMEVTAEGLDRLQSSPDVAAIRPDRLAHPLLDDSTALVQADEAWPTADGTGHSVAIIDMGVDGNHDFLDNTVVYEACFAKSDPDEPDATGACPNLQPSQTGAGSGVPCVHSYCTHGTHVAGIAASDGDPASDSNSYPGVARGADIVSIQVFHDDWQVIGEEPQSTNRVLAYFSDILLALDHLLGPPGGPPVHETYDVAAVNLSLGGFLFDGFCDDQIEPLIYDSVQNLKDEGVTTVVASGNDSDLDALAFPACLSNVISVGNVIASGPDVDRVASDSNAAPFLRMLAPGVTITSAVPDGTVPRNLVGTMSGTSMAAPHVAGAIAVLREAGVGSGLADIDLADHLHGVLRASGPCINDAVPGFTDPHHDDFTRLDVKAAIDWVGLPSALFWDVECGKWYEDAADWLGFDADGTNGPLQPLATGFPDGSFGGNSPISRAQDARMLHRLFGEPSPGGYTHAFTDVPPWVTTAVNWVNWPSGPASPNSLMSGFGDEFRPDASITRGEKARQLFRAAGSPPIDLSCPPSHGFSDVPPWLDESVRWISCAAHGPGGVTPIASGYPGATFRPDNAISRAEVARMLKRFDDAGHVV